MKEYSITLLMPPSENACWFNVPGRGRVNSTAYQKWKKKALQDLMVQKIPRFTGKNIKWGLGKSYFHFKRKRRGPPPDAQNRIHPVIDVISAYIGVDDDIHHHINGDGYAPVMIERDPELVRTKLQIFEAGNNL